MQLSQPQIAKDSFQVDDFIAYTQDFLLQEKPVSAIKSCALQAEAIDLSGLDLKTSLLENCTFHTCSFENASFIDIVFQSCDFSNSKFPAAYFERCRFINCKCIGMDMRDTVIKHTAFERCNLRYSCFDNTRILDALFDTVDFTEASLTKAKLKNFSARNSNFIRSSFYQTMLAGIDFSGNELIAPIVSSPPVELKGAMIDPFQAAGLIGLLGVIVKR